jgi:SNF2 family DNA or RNA helicase
LTLLDNWQREAAAFVPSLQCLVYSGDKTARTAIRQKLVEHIRAQPRTRQADPALPFHILVTSYEFITSDFEFLARFQWRCLIVDEAHRLKNAASVLYTTLQSEYKFRYKLLLTGTPIQNTISGS